MLGFADENELEAARILPEVDVGDDLAPSAHGGANLFGGARWTFGIDAVPGACGPVEIPPRQEFEIA